MCMYVKVGEAGLSDEKRGELEREAGAKSWRTVYAMQRNLYYVQCFQTAIVTPWFKLNLAWKHSESESFSVVSNSLQLHDYTVHGTLQARILEWVAFPSPGNLPNPGIEPRFPALQADSLPAKPQGKHK